MAYCSHCGRQLGKNVTFCFACGRTTKTPAENVAALTKASGKLDIHMLIYSIFNTIMLCMPLGIASLILTFQAKNAHSAQAEAKKLKSATICNVIATIMAFTIFLIWVLFCVLMLILAIIMIIEEPYYPY